MAAALALLGRLPLLIWPLIAALLWGGAGRLELAHLRRSNAVDAAARAATAVAQREQNELQAAGQAAQFEAARAAITARHPNAQQALKKALSAPISCLAASAPALADVRVPGAVLDSLRDAGADVDLNRSPAGQLGGAVLSGTGLAGGGLKPR